jgi:hypothetical protein
MVLEKVLDDLHNLTYKAAHSMKVSQTILKNYLQSIRIIQNKIYLEDGGNTFFRNAGGLLPDCTGSQEL